MTPRRQHEVMAQWVAWVDAAVSSAEGPEHTALHHVGLVQVTPTQIVVCVEAKSRVYRTLERNRGILRAIDEASGRTTHVIAGTCDWSRPTYHMWKWQRRTAAVVEKAASNGRVRCYVAQDDEGRLHVEIVGTGEGMDLAARKAAQGRLESVVALDTKIIYEVSR